MDAIATLAISQKGLFMQQAFKIDVRSLADQNHVKGIGRTYRFLTGEFKHLKGVFEVLDRQVETCEMARVEHPLFLRRSLRAFCI
ncbi:hypothetical protein D3C71_1896690 [compost metagenome]